MTSGSSSGGGGGGSGVTGVYSGSENERNPQGQWLWIQIKL